MARNSAIKHKHYALDEAKIRRAQKLLGTKTETETIERALEEVISERERQRLVWAATERFMRSGAMIQDVFGRLGKRG
jgi:predicted nucleic acid-binding protein